MKSTLSLSGRLIAGCLLVCLVFSAGCKQASSPENAGEVLAFKQIDRKASFEETQNRFFEPPVYIPLKSVDNQVLFGKIDQIKLAGDKIYILDGGIRSLLVFDRQGTAVGKVGTYGQGPEEYLDIAAFDVDTAGRIYFIDGRRDRLFIYDDQLRFVSSTELPFEADQLQVLDNGRYLFALSSWNRGEAAGLKIALTDTALNLLASYLPYDDYRDDNYWISGYQLIKTNTSIVYHQPITSTIYLFSPEGELADSVRLDFGNRTPPDELKKDIERHLNAFDAYSLLKDFTVVTPHFLLGTVWEGRKSKLFLLDKTSGQIVLSPPFDDADHTRLTGFTGSTLIAYIDPDTYEEHPAYPTLSPELIAHLKNGDFVLYLREVKNRKIS